MRGLYPIVSQTSYEDAPARAPPAQRSLALCKLLGLLLLQGAVLMRHLLQLRVALTLKPLDVGVGALALGNQRRLALP